MWGDVAKECWCGAEYRSHAIFDKDAKRMVARKPCPQCGKDDNFRKISSDPETMTLG